jgi:hypothetical protein
LPTRRCVDAPDDYMNPASGWSWPDAGLAPGMGYYGELWCPDHEYMYENWLDCKESVRRIYPRLT